MSELTISAEDYQAQIPDCQEGETISVRATVGARNADGSVTAQVIPESIEKEAPAEDTGETEEAAAPMPPKKKKNPALAAAVGSDAGEGMGY